MGGSPITWYNEDFYTVRNQEGDKDLGYITSAFYSPNLSTNIALAMMPIKHTGLGTKIKVVLPVDGEVDGEIVPTPFVDPGKKIPSRVFSG